MSIWYLKKRKIQAEHSAM